KGSGVLTVNPTPSVTVNSPGTCSGTSATIAASAMGGTGTYTYAWTVPTGATVPGNVASFTTSVAGTYSVQVTDSKGCTGTGSGVLTVNPTPSVTVNSAKVCSGTSATIAASATGGTGTYTYAWTVPVGATVPGNVASFSASVAGTYSVQVTDSKSCTGMGSGVLTVNPTPSVTV